MNAEVPSVIRIVMRLNLARHGGVSTKHSLRKQPQSYFYSVFICCPVDASNLRILIFII